MTKCKGLLVAGMVGVVAFPPGALAASSAGAVEPIVLAAAAQPEGAAALVSAVELGDNKTVSALLSKGASPETTDHRGRTLLMLAALNGKPAIAAMLIKLKANVSAQADGLTPMVAAAMFGDPETVALLIKAGANVNQPVLYDSTPIQYARMGMQGAPAKRPERSALGTLQFAAKQDYEAVVKLLIAAGAK